MRSLKKKSGPQPRGEMIFLTDLREQPSCRRGPAARFWACLPWSQMPPSQCQIVDVLSTHRSAFRPKFDGYSVVAGDLVRPGEALADEDPCHRESQCRSFAAFGIGNVADLSTVRRSLTGKIIRRGRTELPKA